MSTELKYWDVGGIIFPRPILEAEMERLTSLMQHEGWQVLMDLTGIDAQASARIALDPVQPQVQRDIHSATFKAVSWFLTLRDRVEQLKDFDAPITQDAEESTESVNMPDGVLDKILNFASGKGLPFRYMAGQGANT